MAKFLTKLDVMLKDSGEKIWILKSPLVYESDIAGKINVPTLFETDFASVPRVPVFYSLFGDRAHREAVLHDFLYRIDAIPQVERSTADSVFLEAMKVRGKGFFTRYAMYLGVRLGGWTAWHKRKVLDYL